MKSNINKYTAIGLLFICTFCAYGQAQIVNISFNIQLDRVKVDSSTPTPLTSQFFLVADTNNDGFSFEAGTNIGTSSGDIFSNGLFFDGLGGDDLILFRDDETENSSSFTGVISEQTGSLQLGTYGGATWDGGDDLAVVWFPSYTSITSSVMEGDMYGLYSPEIVSSSDPWITPFGSSSNYELFGQTVDSLTGSGLLGADTFLANQMVGSEVIPEPSTYALILGTVGLALVYFKRRRAATES